MTDENYVVLFLNYECTSLEKICINTEKPLVYVEQQVAETAS